jgi:hypothetical protein
MPLIIGLGFESQQGKDVAAAEIIAQRGEQYDIRTYPFARLLKLEVYAALCTPTDPFWPFYENLTKRTPNPDFYWSVKIPKPKSAFSPEAEQLAWIEENKPALRRILQVYGSEYRRFQDPFYWVRANGSRIKEEDPQVALITDMRFLNEAFFVKANDGWTIRCIREGYTNTAASGHMSEHQLKDYEFDYVITAADVETLKADAVEVFDQIIKGLTPPAFTSEDFTEAAFGAAA